MICLEKIKFFAEMITSIATAFIVLGHFVNFCKPIKNFLKITVPAFFIGHTDINGKKTRFCKGLKLRREQTINIINAISPNAEMEEALVLDKKALLDMISNSSVFKKIYLRK